MLRVATFDEDWVDRFRNAVNGQDKDLARKIGLAVSGQKIILYFYSAIMFLPCALCDGGTCLKHLHFWMIVNSF